MLILFNPTSPADNFNRADGAPGPSWSSASASMPVISSNQLTTPLASICVMFWNANAFASNQWSEITATALGGWVAASVRVNAGGAGYSGIVSGATIYIYSDAAWTMLASIAIGAYPAPGTKLRLRVVGSTLTVSLGGVDTLTVTDSTVIGGSPGCAVYSGGTLDNWSGGSL